MHPYQRAERVITSLGTDYCSSREPESLIYKVSSTLCQAKLSTLSTTLLRIDRLIVSAPPCIINAMLSSSHSELPFRFSHRDSRATVARVGTSKNLVQHPARHSMCFKPQHPLHPLLPLPSCCGHWTLQGLTFDKSREERYFLAIDGGDCSRPESPECDASSPGAASDDTGGAHGDAASQQSPGGVPGAGNKTRRRRTAFTSEQLLELEREFHAKKYLSLTERSQIAAALKLSEVQVSVRLVSVRP
ncbi:unnamed protein product [Timema podura]|uniref:Homeobox domain-containing protein n=1 Tax=Timema podura TaxID=61482 RepID=A0ABN7NR91_TIMPD|nr:unnamed protein product [Timema podura]